MIGAMGVSAVDMAEALARIDGRIRSGRPAYVCVSNLRTALLSQKDEAFCRIQNQSFMTLPDGMPLVWYAWLAGRRNVTRVTGPDLMARLLEVSPARGYSHYFLGDTEDTLSKIASVVRRKYGRVVIKGMRSPPFRPLRPSETEEYIEEINALRPSLVWVGLGAPKQELWMADVIGRIRSAVLVGVGAAFRFLIGEYHHPPTLVQDCGLEGLCWRFGRRPLRTLRRYAGVLPAYGWLVAKMLARRTLGRTG